MDLNNCPDCGKEIPGNMSVCQQCWVERCKKTANTSSRYTQPQQTKQQNQYPDSYSYQPQKKKNTGLIVTVVIGSVIIIGILILVINSITANSKPRSTYSGTSTRRTCSHSSAFGDCTSAAVDGDSYCNSHTKKICLLSFCDVRVGSNGVYCHSHFQTNKCADSWCSRPATDGSYCSYHKTS